MPKLLFIMLFKLFIFSSSLRAAEIISRESFLIPSISYQYSTKLAHQILKEGCYALMPFLDDGTTTKFDSPFDALRSGGHIASVIKIKVKGRVGEKSYLMNPDFAIRPLLGCSLSQGLKVKNTFEGFEQNGKLEILSKEMPHYIVEVNFLDDSEHEIFLYYWKSPAVGVSVVSKSNIESLIKYE